MPSFATGVVKFHRDVFPEKKALFEKLSTGQAPEALFITCSDSRIATGMITQTDPGELFVCRNPGNIVPPYDAKAGDVSASIEYALEVLNVGHIVICGHTDCGAVRGAANPDGVSHLGYVAEWLSFAGEAVRRADAVLDDGADEAARIKLITQQNVIVQLENLAGHPAVRSRLDAGALKIHGWIYDIGSGNVYVLDQDHQAFVPIEEKYAERLEAEAKLIGV